MRSVGLLVCCDKPRVVFSKKFPRDRYVDMLPGWLNMYRNPQEIFPEHVKVIQMSQSDFALPRSTTRKR